MLQAFFANLSIAILDGAYREPHGQPFVAAPVVNSKMVNGSAPDLFRSPLCLTSIEFLPQYLPAVALSRWEVFLQYRCKQTAFARS